MAREEFVGAAPQTTLASGINDTALSLTLTDGTGYPTGTNPFVLTIDAGQATEEKVLCTSRSGDTVTVDAAGRGYDDTTPVAHSTGATVEHTISAAKLNELDAHVNGTNSKHVQVGTSFPSSPSEGMIAIRTDQDRWYIRAASGWYRGGAYSTSGWSNLQLTKSGSTAISANTPTAITWTSEFEDDDGWASAPDSTLVVPSGAEGPWAWHVGSITGSGTLGAADTITMFVNGTAITEKVFAPTGSDSQVRAVDFAPLYLSAGDEIVFKIRLTLAQNLTGAILTGTRLGLG